VVSGIPREGAEETPRVQVTGAVVEMAGQQVLLMRIASLDGSITTLQVARVVVAGSAHGVRMLYWQERAQGDGY